MQSTITNMASCYTGGNNLPLLARSGEAGSRLCGGKDAASPRYLETHLEDIARIIFSTHDDPLLTPMVDDGKIVEPMFYVPVIPMILANPCKGAIGTGWSATLPGYNPLDLANCVEMWLKNDGSCTDEDGAKIFPEITPWYRGFKGLIEKTGKHQYTTHGIVERVDKNKVEITELPVGYWTENFHEYLKTLKAEGYIKGFTCGHTVSEVYFLIEEKPDGMDCEVESNLKLTTTLSTSNMVLFDENGLIKKFSDVYEIIDHFCRVKFGYMARRKMHLLSKLNHEKIVHENKLRFISEVITKKLVIFQVPEAEIVDDLEKKKYDRVDKKFEYLLSMQVRTFTKNKMDELEKDISKLAKMISDLENTSEKTLWLRDLKSFRKAYENMLASLEKELNIPLSKKKKK